MRKDQKTDERTGRVRRFTRWFWTILCIPAGALLLLVALTAAGAFGRLPSFEELENPKSNLATEIYAADGELIGSFYVQNRSYVDYEDLSPALVAALVSTEDARFYTHSGIDFISLSRVAIKTLALGRRDQGGGSTITQQLAKNLWFSFEKRFERKVAEVFAARRLERMLTKDEILELYINVVWFGEGCTGLRAAARHYYGCEPMALSPGQCQALVDTLKSPATRNPNALAE